MNLGAMHIGVQHGVDKINSMHSDLLLPEEIDLELNKNIQRFINQRWTTGGNKYRAGFEESQKRIDDLRTLIREFSTPTVYKGHVFDKVYIDAGFLPADYMFLINMKSLTQNYNCVPYEFNIMTVLVGELTFEMDTDHTVIAQAGFTSFIGAYLAHDDGTSAPVLPPATPLTTPFTGVDNIWAFHAWILDPANWAPEVKSIVILGLQTAHITLHAGFSSVGGATVLLHPGNGTFTSSMTTPPTGSTLSGFGPQFLYSDKRVNGVDDDGNPLPYTTGVSMNKFMQHDDIFKILSDPFNNTTLKSPLYSIKDGHIEVYTDDTFIVDKIKITYLKRPVQVDIINSPGIQCDLPDTVHQEIVDMAVNSILEEISDPRYQSSSMEILKSE
jgi:hypothetical protein